MPRRSSTRWPRRRSPTAPRPRTLSGHIAAGTLVPPGNVTITLNHVAVSAPIDSNGDFQAQFNTAALGVSGSPYPITYAYQGDTGFDAAQTVTTYLTVKTALLTIAVGDYSRYAGQPNPVFTASYSGFVSGQGPGALNGSLTISTPANPSSPAGVYPIVPGGLSSPNYAITYENGSLVVTPAPVTVHAVGWQNRSLGRKKSVQVLAITFSGPLNQATALNVNAYRLAAPTTNKKHVTVYSSVIKLGSPLYNPLTNTVTLEPMKSVPKKLLQLTINGSLISGGNYVGMIHG